jgi:hypothetical protein
MLTLVCLEMVLIVMQDSCTVLVERTVCAERTTSSKIILDAPNETHR